MDLHDDAAYEAIAKRIFARGRVPDGYAGKMADVGFALFDDEIVVVCDAGYFKAGLPKARPHQRARDLLRHHPSARHITLLDEGIWHGRAPNQVCVEVR